MAVQVFHDLEGLPYPCLSLTLLCSWQLIGQVLVRRFIKCATRILGGGFEGGAAFLQEAGEVLAGEAPLEGRCDSLPVVLKVEKALGECVEGGEIIGGEDFSLDDREVDFDLVEPAGMNGTVDQDQARILLLEALNGGETAMRRAVVDDPEHAAGRRYRGGRS